MRAARFGSARSLRASVVAAALLAPLAAAAQAVAAEAPAVDHSKMDHSKTEMDHSAMGHGSAASDKTKDAMPGMAMDKKMDQPMDMDAMMKSMQGGKPPPGARDPDAYSDGLAHGPMPGMDMADNDPYLQVSLNQLELFRSRDGERGQAFGAQAWFGTDLNRLWLKASGERSDGRLGATRLEALWSRAIAPYLALQTGVRHDVGEGPSRTWAAFGVQGLAPYWFELEATAYASSRGRTALRLEAEYELLITQRLVLQPDVEVNLYGKSDPERGIGSGLSDIDVGLRLRYEFSRKFAPYVGVVFSRKFSRTADLARAAGEPLSDTQVVAGIRLWF